MRGRGRGAARTARRVLVGAGVLTAAGFALLVSPQPARAEIVQSGGAGCTASINGSQTDLPFTSDNAISVVQHVDVTVTMHMATPVHRRLITVGFGLGPSVTASDETDPSSEITTVAVDKYATYGIGLYAVNATADSASGQHCEIHQMVSIEGNPLTTVAGGAASGLTLLALAGMAGAGVAGANPGDAGKPVDPADEPNVAGGWPKSPLEADTPGQAIDRTMNLSTFGFCLIASLPALLLTSAAMAGGAAPGGDGTRRLGRVHWRPRISIVGILSGLVGGLAVMVLLQQSGRLFPSYEILGRALAGGLVMGILIPSLTRLIAVRRANRRIAMREMASAARYR